MNTQEIKKFKQFLIERKLYGKFKKNVKEDLNQGFVGACKDEEEARDIIRGAFYWEGTKEGLEFWTKVNKEWENIISEERAKGNE